MKAPPEKLIPSDERALRALARYPDTYAQESWDSPNSYRILGNGGKNQVRARAATIRRFLQWGFIAEKPGVRPVQYVLTEAGRRYAEGERTERLADDAE